MTIQQHTDAARRFREMAHDADLGGHMAEERGDAITAADQLDEREFWHRLAAHHEEIAAYATSLNSPDSHA